jgi:glutaredoxin-like protein NrdH
LHFGYCGVGGCFNQIREYRAPNSVANKKELERLATMKTNHVNGNDRGVILLYALSTCIWCRKTKTLLAELGVAYDYVDVDLLGGSDRTQAENEMIRWNPQCSFPTLVIGDQTSIAGYDELRIRQALAG